MSKCAEVEAAVKAIRVGDDRSTRAVFALIEVDDCIIAGLRRAADCEDWYEFKLYSIAASHFPDVGMTDLLCEVLSRQLDDVNNEDVVTLLDTIADPASIPFLETALWWEPDWDEYRHLGKKCLWALHRIGDERARTVVENVAEVGPDMLRDEAREALDDWESGVKGGLWQDRQR